MQRSPQNRNDASRPRAKRIVHLAASCLLIVAGGISVSAQAASFKCGSHSSYSELQVCQNATLSQLDDKLAIAWKQALDVSPDKQSLSDARDQQWKWRQANCHDTACVTNWYERRLSELHADIVVGKQAQGQAFEANLDQQKLAPGAAATVRAMKTGVPAGQLAAVSLEQVRTMHIVPSPLASAKPVAVAAVAPAPLSKTPVRAITATSQIVPAAAKMPAPAKATVKTSALPSDTATIAQSAAAPLQMAPASVHAATTTEAAVTPAKSAASH